MFLMKYWYGFKEKRPYFEDHHNKDIFLPQYPTIVYTNTDDQSIPHTFLT